MSTPSAPAPRPTISDWLEGARLRTLPAALAPVLAGTGAAGAGANLTRALLATVVALALQIGVNFANDYSDGIRGTDEHRVGPTRLTATGLVPPRTVKLIAFAWFGVAMAAGVALVAVSGLWWLLAVGAVAVVAAWFYTGGAKPYGYAGLGEVAVFVFFGLVATWGTTYTQVGVLNAVSALAGVAMGLVACALLMINNIRDIATDTVSGKRTLAVRLGDSSARVTYAVFMIGGAAFTVAALIAQGHWTGWAAAPLVAIAVLLSTRVITRLAHPIATLRDTGLVQLGFGLVLAAGILV